MAGGFETLAFCEIELYCQRVLAKHWPHVVIYSDIRELTYERIAADGVGDIDVICGGFPCQDISVSGKRAGLNAPRSGLWSEFARLIGEIRPQYAIVENTSALLRDEWLGRVLGDLAKIGYDAEWHCIPASYVGAHHQRDRIWIVANPMCGEVDIKWGDCELRWDAVGWDKKATQQKYGESNKFFSNKFSEICLREGWSADYWKIEPNVDRMVDGIPNGLDRLRALGNAVVPQVVEMIGRAIMAANEAR